MQPVEAKSEQQSPGAAGAVLEGASMQEKPPESADVAPSNVNEAMGLQDGANSLPQNEPNSEGPSCDLNSELF